MRHGYLNTKRISVIFCFLLFCIFFNSHVQAASEWTVREVNELKVQPPEEAMIENIVFTSADNGLIQAYIKNTDTGDGHRKILHTTDGGNTWTVVLPNATYPQENFSNMKFDGCFGVVQYRSPSEGLFVTTDCGSTWSIRSTPAGKNVTALTPKWPFIYAGTDDGYIYNSFDTGFVWFEESTPFSGRDQWGRGICRFYNIHVGTPDSWMIASGYKLGGGNCTVTKTLFDWEDATSFIPLLGSLDFWQMNGIGLGDPVLPNSCDIFYSGYPPDGNYWTWTQANCPEDLTTYDLDMVTMNQGWSVGHNSWGQIMGKIYKTNDYGVHWTEEFNSNSLLVNGCWNLHSISMVDMNLGYATGECDLYRNQAVTRYPLLFKYQSPKPELIIYYNEITTNPVNPAPGQDVDITVTVRNEGSVDTPNGFWVDIYKDRATPPVLYQNGDGWCWINGLTAGASATCTITVRYDAAGTYQIWAQVDNYEHVQEKNETNNVSGPQPITVCQTNTYYSDADADGYGNPNVTTQACTQPTGYVANNTDCDDTNEYVHPNATETCNDVDDDCDGQIDEGTKTTYYQDFDGDGYGNPNVSWQWCTQPGLITDNTDCNDNNAAIHPGAAEICNGVDDNCNGQIDEGVCQPLDLAVTAVTGPTTGKPGTTITVGDTTKNNGPGNAPESTTKFYWSTNSTFDAADAYLGARLVPALAALATNKGTITVTVPANACAGTFYIIAKADADNLIAETNEANNPKSKTIKTGADLVVFTVTTSPAASGAGKTLTVTDTTKNSGGCPAGASTTKLYLSTNGTWDAADIYLGQRIVPALAAGATNAGPTVVTIPAGTATGSYSIIAKADANAAVTETSETNNNKGKTIKIGPDLVVSLLTAPTSAVRGTSISITDTTKNTGGGDAVASTTKLYLSTNNTYDAADVYLGQRAVPNIAAGATNAGPTAVTIPAGTTPGAYYIIAVSDANAVVTETSETNNNKSKLITINP